jgi:hypothetical protein
MARAARSQVAGLPLGLRRAITAALWLYLLLSAFVLWRAAVLTPYADEIDWVARWYGFKASHDWAAYLFAPVNFHRIPAVFGLLALDIQALRGTNLPLIASGAAGLALMALVLARQAAQAAPPVMKLPGAALAAMLSLMAGSVLDAATPICVNYIHGAFFAVLAIVLAEGADGRNLAWRGPLALLCAAAAGLGDGAALAVWPVLALGAAQARRWRWLVLILGAGALFLAIYMRGQLGAAGASAAGALQHPFAAARLTLAYLLLPWSRLLMGFAWIGGLAVAVIAVAALAVAVRRHATPAKRTAGALILFTLATAVMAGLGRSTLEDAANVPLRYAVLVTPLHVGLLMLALPWVGELWRANRTAAQALMAVLVAGVLAQDLLMAAKVVRASDVNRNLVADFKAGIRTPPMRVTVHPDLAHAQAIYARLKSDRLFQRELHLKARPASR